MSFRSARVRIATAAISAVVAGTLGLSASPAAAAKSDGYVRGYNDYKGDWSDEGELAFDGGSWFDDNNAVCLWQKILWAEGAEETNGSYFDAADVDGQFGPNTLGATEFLQDRWGLRVDGVVGGSTFGRADDELRVTSGSDDPGRQLNMTYYGDRHSFSVVRNSEGKYSFRDGDNDWRIAGYGYRTCN
ncbi:peptidoglycan-binding protein [Streptomyces sp. NBC_01506]|uniref:peptidoglycan-binding domain-containing protein n=1 Tax=Streptomyces sp. NBC_01506 TaxID=2903887 RepID=UPI00386F9135